MDWDHKDEWLIRKNTFTVTVTRHNVHTENDKGHNRWCVYAYIYPTHPHFKNFDGNYMWQPAALELPLHGFLAGPSLLKWHRDNDGSIGSVQVGADYNHIDDERFTFMTTKEEALEVFQDAEILINFLERMESEAIKEDL